MHIIYSDMVEERERDLQKQLNPCQGNSLEHEEEDVERAELIAHRRANRSSAVDLGSEISGEFASYLHDGESGASSAGGKFGSEDLASLGDIDASEKDNSYRLEFGAQNPALGRNFCTES